MGTKVVCSYIIPQQMSLSAIKRATMASLSTKSNTNYNIRSISFPARSHPSLLKVEEELNKLKTFDSPTSPKAETICIGLSSLAQLYKCIEELLNLPMTQQALLHNQSQRLVNGLLEESVKFIDICSNTRDMVLSMKESVRELQSSLRRRMVIGKESIESDLNAYIFSRKKMKKGIANSLAIMKQIENNLGSSNLLDLDHHINVVVRVLKDTSLITISIFQSLMLFLGVPILKPKVSKWSMVTRLVLKGVVDCDGVEKNMNELESVEIALSNLFLHSASDQDHDVVERIQIAYRRLEMLDFNIEGLENGLECLFRQLINIRVSLLNMLSN